VELVIFNRHRRLTTTVSPGLTDKMLSKAPLWKYNTASKANTKNKVFHKMCH
jgi:hypothetical protein